MVNRTSFRCSSEPGSRPVRTRHQSCCVRAVITLWLVGLVSLGPLRTAHAEVVEIYEMAELEEFQYRRLVDYAEAAGYALDTERQLEYARQPELWDMLPDDRSNYCLDPYAIE
jgi:hypothetical protein